jgi:hypothetical protein
MGAHLPTVRQHVPQQQANELRDGVLFAVGARHLSVWRSFFDWLVGGGGDLEPPTRAMIRPLAHEQDYSLTLGLGLRRRRGAERTEHATASASLARYSWRAMATAPSDAR